MRDFYDITGDTKSIDRTLSVGYAQLMSSRGARSARILLDELRRVVREHGDLESIDLALARRGAIPGHLRRVLRGRAVLRLDVFELILEHTGVDRYDFLRRLGRRIKPARSLAEDIDVLLETLPSTTEIDDDAVAAMLEDDDGLAALFDDIVPLDEDDDPLGPVN